MKDSKLCLSCEKKVFSTTKIIMESNPKPVSWKKKMGLKILLISLGYCYLNLINFSIISVNNFYAEVFNFDLVTLLR